MRRAWGSLGFLPVGPQEVAGGRGEPQFGIRNCWQLFLVELSFKKPLPRAHPPASESTCSSRRWEVGAGVERGEERLVQLREEPRSAPGRGVSPGASRSPLSSAT